MIGSPDLLAFTTETDFKEKPADPFELPEDLTVPLYPPSSDSTPWSGTSKVKFDKDFVLIAEFSEQIGPQPLLTIPEGSKACGSFDLNHFSLRIMSVDYQTSFASPCTSGCAKLNFVEDSKVVLADSKEGAYAYVHHLTLYDLEARGFVRPFCMAYVSSDEQKIMHNFLQLSAEFSKASECLKTGNRKNFANELEKKLRDLEYTRLVLLREIKTGGLQKLFISENNGGKGLTINRLVKGDKDSEKGNGKLLLTAEEQKSKERCGLSFKEELKEHNGTTYLNEGEINSDDAFFTPSSRTAMLPDKAAELANVEKAIQEHRNLLKQVTSYPTRKLQDSEFLPYEPDNGLQSLEHEVEPYVVHTPEPGTECSVLPHTPQLVSSSSCRQFDKRLKNLEELCDEYFLQQAQKQLRYIEKSFRRDNGYLSSWQFTQNLLQDLKSTNFLFEDFCNLEAEAGQQFARPEVRSTLLPVSPQQSEPFSLESFTSCVEMVPIKLEVNERGRPPFAASPFAASPCDDMSLMLEASCPDEEVAPVPMKDSISSGDSIEVLGTEKSFRTQGSHIAMETALPKPPLLHSLSLEHKRWRASARRMNSEDSIEVLSTTDSIIPEDLRASYPSAIHEESPEHEEKEEEEKKVTAPVQEDKNAPLFTGRQVSRQDSQSSPSTPTIILSPPDTCLDSPLSTVISQEPCPFVSPLFYMVDAGCGQEGQFQLTQDDFSDCTSYLSLASTLSDASLLTVSNGEKSTGANRRRRAKLGRVSLRFLRHFPFAAHAVYSLLSGRTLVVLGSEETVVRRWVTALTIYTPHMRSYRESIQPWTSDPLQITDLLNWKLIGYNRMASATSPNMPPCLGRFSRYLSVLDVDQRTLRSPTYRGSLISPLVAPRTQITRGTTFFAYAQSVLGKLVSKAFLLAFSHSIHHPSSDGARARAERVVGDYHDDDMRILRFLSEQIRTSFAETPASVLRFSYTASTLFKQ